MEETGIFQTDITIIGTGIHGSHLLRRIAADPIISRRRIVTVDPSPTPCATWKKRTRNCGMRYLRSPASHGISPQLSALRRFADECSLADEFGCEAPFIPPYHRPSLALFNRHVELESQVFASRSTHLNATLSGIETEGPFYRVHVTHNDGAKREVISRDVILAVGTSSPHIPHAFRGIDRVQHVYDPTFRRDAIPEDSNVAIVGGGIAAAHLAIDLAKRLGSVTILNRDPFYPAQFDSDPCFIGPKCGDRFRRIRDIRERRRTIQESRRSGSVPPDLFAEVQAMQTSGALEIVPATVYRARVTRAGIEVFGHGTLPFHKEYQIVILATGFDTGPPQSDLISSIAQKNGLLLHEDGFPLVTEDLGWKEVSDSSNCGTVYCTGALAELEIGPPARNIIGAHLAGRRIVPRLRREYETTRYRVIR